MGRLYTQLAVDDFQRPDENPLTAAKWTLETGFANLQIKSRLAVSTVLGVVNTCGMYYSGAALPNNQYVEAVLGPLSSSGSVAILARGAVDGSTGYELSVIGQTGTGNALLIAGGGLSTQIILPFSTSVGDKFRIECLGPAITFLYNGVVLYSQSDLTLGSGVTVAQISSGSSVTDTGLLHFAAGSIVSTGPSPGTVLGVFEGTSVSNAFTNPSNQDLVQVVNEGGQVVWNLSSSGVAIGNPTNPTPNAVLGKFEGQFFNTAFPTSTLQLDILQVRNQGGGLVFRVDFLGNVFTS